MHGKSKRRVVQGVIVKRITVTKGLAALVR